MEERQVKLQEVVSRLNAAARAAGYSVKCYKPTRTGCEVRYTNLLTTIEETSKVYPNLGAALDGEIDRLEEKAKPLPFCAFPAMGYWEIDGKPVSSKEAQSGLHPRAIWRETEIAKAYGAGSSR